MKTGTKIRVASEIRKKQPEVRELSPIVVKSLLWQEDIAKTCVLLVWTGRAWEWWIEWWK